MKSHRLVHTRASLEAAGMVVPNVLFDEAIANFEAGERASPTPPGGVVFYGDSDIGYWNREGVFQESFAGLSAVNRGFGGARVWETLIYFHRVLVPLQPRLLVYNCGDNDVCALGTSAAENVRIGFRLLLDAVARDLPSVARVVCLAIHPAPSRNDRGLWPLQAGANAVLRELCAHGRAQYEDALELLGGDPRNLNAADFLDDRTHYSPAFYRRLGAWLRPRLA
jgi:lysophospholipase L1-like esterase